MKRATLLQVLSLLSILLVTIHITDDIARGYAPGGLGNLPAILFLALWLYATLCWIERRWGLAIVLLGAVAAIAMPVLHMTGKGVGGAFGQTPGAAWFIWTLYALGITGTVSAALAIVGLVRTPTAT